MSKIEKPPASDDSNPFVVIYEKVQAKTKLSTLDYLHAFHAQEQFADFFRSDTQDPHTLQQYQACGDLSLPENFSFLFNTILNQREKSPASPKSPALPPSISSRLQGPEQSFVSGLNQYLGLNTDINYQNAYGHFQKAADRGRSAPLLTFLYCATIKLKGLDGEVDVDKAADWLYQGYCISHQTNDKTMRSIYLEQLKELGLPPSPSKDSTDTTEEKTTALSSKNPVYSRHLHYYLQCLQFERFTEADFDKQELRDPLFEEVLSLQQQYYPQGKTSDQKDIPSDQVETFYRIGSLMKNCLRDREPKDIAQRVSSTQKSAFFNLAYLQLGFACLYSHPEALQELPQLQSFTYVLANNDECVRFQLTNLSYSKLSKRDRHDFRNILWTLNHAEQKSLGSLEEDRHALDVYTHIIELHQQIDNKQKQQPNGHQQRTKSYDAKAKENPQDGYKKLLVTLYQQQEKNNRAAKKYLLRVFEECPRAAEMLSNDLIKKFTLFQFSEKAKVKPEALKKALCEDLKDEDPYARFELGRQAYDLVIQCGNKDKLPEARKLLTSLSVMNPDEIGKSATPKRMEHMLPRMLIDTSNFMLETLTKFESQLAEREKTQAKTNGNSK